MKEIKEIREWIESFIIALIIVLPVSFFCRPTIVEGQSMQPTLYNYNIVITERNTKDLVRGQIIVFDARPIDKCYYIKRVIGLPGDVIEIRDGAVYVNESRLVEIYLKKGTITEGKIKIRVPSNEVFVLGDNRSVSSDSREIGTISIDKIKGHAYFRIFPFNKTGSL